MKRNKREEQQEKKKREQEENTYIYTEKNNKHKDSPCHTNNINNTGEREESYTARSKIRRRRRDKIKRRRKERGEINQ